ncbi:MAG: polysulfide reductase NrfD [Magnetococcales bacterium]|nr:polysulfide reductase NrfD [Magnetococcales bacterium]
MLSQFSAIEGRSFGYWKLVIFLGVLALMGLGAFVAVEINGHGITGMNNKIAWGIPHVFAISLLVMASGALNVGSMSTVFAVKQFKQFGRFSAFLAIALLIGGLAVLMLDLGRPDRLLLTVMHMNFRSMFTLNVFLYSGFILLCFLYLWSMFEYQQFTKVIGSAAFLWRVILTTGTGSIFGVIHAREVFHSAITAPTFVAISLSSGTAISILLLVTTFKRTNRVLEDKVVFGLRNAFIFFTFLVAYLLVVEKFTRYYSPAFYDVQSWILTGPYAWLYLFGVWGATIIIPLAVLFNPKFGNSIGGVMVASFSSIIGTFAFVAHLLLAGQSYPLKMFPGYEVSSAFLDGQVATYTPALIEFVLGFGGIGIAGVIYLLGIKFFRMIPNEAVAPEGYELPWNP